MSVNATLETSNGAPKIVAVIQARMSSSRLPGKVLKQLGDKLVLDWVVDAVQRSRTIDQIVLATSEDPSDDVIEDFARTNGIDCYRGPLDDVLARFVGAVNTCASDADAIVRITADCPLLDPRIIDMVAGAWQQAQWIDYASTAITRWMPRGLDVELISTQALARAHELATEFHRVHVTSYVYSHPELFSVFGIHNANDYSQFRVTLDTPEDYELISAVVTELNGHVPTVENIVAMLTDKPELVSLNAAITQKQLSEG